jgi:hypothetical protein
MGEGHPHGRGMGMAKMMEKCPAPMRKAMRILEEMPEDFRPWEVTGRIEASLKELTETNKEILKELKRLRER